MAIAAYRLEARATYVGVLLPFYDEIAISLELESDFQ